MSNTIKQLEWRYAVKKFDATKLLSDDKINTLKKAFNLTATSYGLQPITLAVIQNKELQKELVPHSFNQSQVEQASHILVICIENEVDSAYISKYFTQVKKVRGTSDAILNPFKESIIENFSNKEVQEIKDWSKNQAYLAMGNLLTICALEEIDSCPMEGFEPSAYDEVLNLKEKGLTSVLVLPVGYRADDDMFSTFKKVRKDMDDCIIEIS
ncbi:MAG: NAD(P)H-dependent oxidoreductase [Maribacter sp.]